MSWWCTAPHSTGAHTWKQVLVASRLFKVWTFIATTKTRAKAPSCNVNNGCVRRRGGEERRPVQDGRSKSTLTTMYIMLRKRAPPLRPQLPSPRQQAVALTTLNTTRNTKAVTLQHTQHITRHVRGVCTLSHNTTPMASKHTYHMRVDVAAGSPVAGASGVLPSTEAEKPIIMTAPTGEGVE